MANPSKPSWLKIKASSSAAYENTKRILRSLSCKTVCEEAACPNARECWAEAHAAFMILGDICTRRCTFCNVNKGSPGGVIDHTEPERLANAVDQLNLRHVVITSVTRDDLPDGGAQQFVRCIDQIRMLNSKIIVEVLTPDFFNKPGAIEMLIDGKPDIFNHNLEVVPRLYPTIVPGSKSYKRSMALLARVKELDPTLFTKSGLMLGLGETTEEVLGAMDDMRSVGVDFVVLGQYLQPSTAHAEPLRYLTPEEFDEFAEHARKKGFSMVSSSPFARSSFHAYEDFEMLIKHKKAFVAV